MPEIVQAVIALAGLLIASLPQLTSKARLRAWVIFWGNQTSASDLEHDRKIAESLRRGHAPGCSRLKRTTASVPPSHPVM
jgi:hypothetical protein